MQYFALVWVYLNSSINLISTVIIFFTGFISSFSALFYNCSLVFIIAIGKMFYLPLIPSVFAAISEQSAEKSMSSSLSLRPLEVEPSTAACKTYRSKYSRTKRSRSSIPLKKNKLENYERNKKTGGVCNKHWSNAYYCCQGYLVGLKSLRIW